MKITALIVLLVCTNLLFKEQYSNQSGVRIVLVNLIGTALSANILVRDYEYWQLYGLFFLVFTIFSCVFFDSAHKLLTDVLLFISSSVAAGLCIYLMGYADNHIFTAMFAIWLYVAIKIYRMLYERNRFVMFKGLLLILFVFIEVISLYYIHDIKDTYVTIEFISLAILLFLAIDYFHDRETVNMERQIMNDQIRAYEDQLSMLKASETFTKGIRHDIKNHMQVLYGLIKDGESTNALNYIDDITKQINKFKPVVNTGNIELDSIINGKINVINTLGYTLNRKITIPTDMPIDAYDAVVVVSNLLDNAINAEKNNESDEHIIDFMMVYNKGVLIIQVCNGCNVRKTRSKLLLKASALPPEMKSRNPNPLLHGLGIKNVLRVVDKYSGSVTLTIHDGRWIMDVMMYL